LFNQHELIRERAKRGVYSIRPGITGLSQVQKIDMSTPVLLAETDAEMLAQLNLGFYFKFIVLTVLGTHVQLARPYRKLSAEQVTKRAGISRKTVYNIEQGIPTVAMCTYLQGLFVLGLEQDFSAVAALHFLP
jgi:DNA-binding XRE family transcriptional regulator